MLCLSGFKLYSRSVPLSFESVNRYTVPIDRPFSLFMLLKFRRRLFNISYYKRFV